MTDKAEDAVHVTAVEDHAHPALQKLARAFIALARLRRQQQATDEPADELTKADGEHS